MTAPKLLAPLYVSANTAGDRAACQDFMRYVLECERTGEVAELNELLAIADPALLSKTSITAVLRSTSSLRNNLPNWYVLRDKCKTHLENTGVDPASLMAGLLHDRPYVDDYHLNRVLLKRHTSLK